MLDTEGAGARLVADPSPVANAQEGLKRGDPAVTVLSRAASKRLTLNGQRINADDTIFMSAHALGRDHCSRSLSGLAAIHLS